MRYKEKEREERNTDQELRHIGTTDGSKIEYTTVKMTFGYMIYMSYIYLFKINVNRNYT